LKDEVDRGGSVGEDRVVIEEQFRFHKTLS
jgi:hypothetical protein